LKQRRAGRHRPIRSRHFGEGPIDEGDAQQRIDRHYAFHHAAQDGFQSRAFALQRFHHHPHPPRSQFERLG